MAHCDGCTMCCKLLGIPELKKMPGSWCSHCDIGKGCRIYDERPESCRNFECLWLQSQSRPSTERLPAALRPDRCKVVLAPTTNPRVVTAHVDPGQRDAWQRPDVHALIALLAHGLHVVIGWGMGRDKILVYYDRDRNAIVYKSITMSAADENGMQWSTHQDYPEE